MKTVNLELEKVDLEKVIGFARKGPVLMLTRDGREFFVSDADDFEREVAILRNSTKFQRFLEKRLAGAGSIPLAQVEQRIEKELAKSPRRTRKRTSPRAK